MIATLFKLVCFLWKISQKIAILIFSSFILRILRFFFSVIGMSPKNARKAKLESAHSFILQFCYCVIRSWQILNFLVLDQTRKVFHWLQGYTFARKKLCFIKLALLNWYFEQQDILNSIKQSLRNSWFEILIFIQTQKLETLLGVYCWSKQGSPTGQNAKSTFKIVQNMALELSQDFFRYWNSVSIKYTHECSKCAVCKAHCSMMVFWYVCTLYTLLNVRYGESP